MKKFFLVLLSAGLLSACGEDQQTKVCACSKIYDQVFAAADKADEEGGNSSEAREKAIADSKGEFESCEKFHAEVGDEKFYEMSQKCGK